MVESLKSAANLLATVALIAALALWAKATPAGAYSIAWDIPSDGTGIDGYELHHGESSEAYDGIVSISGYETDAATVDVPDGARFMALRSVGEELYSEFSNEILVGAEPAVAPTMRYLFVQYDESNCPCSIWNDSALPSVQSDSDPAAVELGVKFQVETDGVVTGIRFYKGSANTGLHIGRLWDSSGVLLATVTFTGETETGWQQAEFSEAVAVDAGVLYVASYNAPDGGYAADAAYFEAEFSSSPFSVPADGGVYLYGDGGFPVNTFGATNYWVDVVFSPN